MKTLILVTGGRGGSDFFQGLLDNHEQILQVPGILRINKEFLNIFKQNSKKEIAQNFINYVPLIFDSKKNKLERHDKLGKKKNEFYIVNKNKFIRFFIKLSSSKKTYKNVSRLKILQNLFEAYYLARNKKINKLKIILLHTHTVDYTKKLLALEKIKNFSIIHTIRHPINALASPISNWLKYKNGIYFFPINLYFQYNLAFNGLSDLSKIGGNLNIILLENLISNKKKVMMEFCKKFKIKYSNKLLNCTYFGKQWWGDQISGRWIGKKIKVKKNNKNDINNKIFYEDDLIYYNGLTNNIIYKYFKRNLKQMSKSNFNYKILPTKAEILVWKNTLKHKKYKHILSIPYFYLKRVIFLNSFFVKNKKLPYSIGPKIL